MSSYEPTPFQHALLRYRGHVSILSSGGRGSGKTMALMMHVIDHCRDFGEIARPLVLRESWQSLQELSLELLDMARAAFGPKVRRNKSEGCIYLPTGGIIYLSNVSDENAVSRLMGRSFSFLAADEVGDYTPKAWKFMQKVRSNLRVPPGRKVTCHYSANPHGRSHTSIHKGFILKAPPWTPFMNEHGEMWMHTTSSYLDNPHISPDEYRLQILNSCGHDTALANAWLKGSWSVLGGVMFDKFSEKHHLLHEAPQANYWRMLGGDWGSAAPAVATLLGMLREDYGRMKRGSIVCLREVDTALPNDLSIGTGAPPQVFAEMIREMCELEGLKRPPPMVMDDMRGLQGDTVNKIMCENGLHAHRPHRKNRVGSWQLIRQMLASAITCDGPGLYITRHCEHLLETLPAAPRSTLRPEDIDVGWTEDHWMDSISYGITEMKGGQAGSGVHRGMT